MQNIPGWAVFLAALFVIEVLVINFVLILLGLKLLFQKSSPAAAPVQALVPQPAPVYAAPERQAPANPAPVQDIPNRAELIAAVVASIAEYEGTEISALRVVSFQQRRVA